uniref:Uncharacterized protein LOC108041266 n=1 Tax=Drosophila rhopaloa TaxID=1041015 RepID=A0A6P4EMV7_DRORH
MNILDVKVQLQRFIFKQPEYLQLRHMNVVLDNEVEISKVWLAMLRAGSEKEQILIFNQNGDQLEFRLQLLEDMGGDSSDKSMDVTSLNHSGSMKTCTSIGKPFGSGDSKGPKCSKVSSQSDISTASSSLESSSSVSSDSSNGCNIHDPCEIKCCIQEDRVRPPFAKVMPEMRRYGLVFSNDENPCDCDFSCILIFLVQRFQQSHESRSLTFSECTSVESFDCNLLIVCENDDTSDWILRETRAMCPPYKCTTFLRHFELVRVSFVIPMVVKKKLCRIFGVFEKQNCSLDTSKWCVMSQTPLDPCSEDYQSKVVYEGAKHVEIIAYIDQESVDVIKSRCSTICALHAQLSQHRNSL